MDNVKFKGKLFTVEERKITQIIKVDNREIEKNLTYEIVRRGPGVRAIVVKNNKILLNREYRYELGEWDYRLPGGKVFDLFTDYETAIRNNEVQKMIEKQLDEELMEEADIKRKKSNFMEISRCGFTIEWDLYYFLINDFEILPSFYDTKIQKSEYEFIEHCWIEYSKVLSMCLNGELAETRSAFVLIKYLVKEMGK